MDPERQKEISDSNFGQIGTSYDMIFWFSSVCFEINRDIAFR
jgi:hypothetical protein